MPTWVKSRVRARNLSTLRVEALEERWLLSGGPGPSSFGTPDHAAAVVSGRSCGGAMTDSSSPAPAGQSGCAGPAPSSIRRT